MPWGKEYDALADKLFNGETLTAEEEARFDELSSVVQNMQDTYKTSETRYLDDYVKDNLLFEAYPELKQVRVEMYNDPESLVGATWYQTGNSIRINEASLASIDLQKLLAHEMQHAIQDIEGFAMGGSKENKQLKETEEYKDWQDMLERARNITTREKELHDALNKCIEDYDKLDKAIDDFFFGSYDPRRDADFLNERKQELKGIQESIYEIVKKIEDEGEKRGKKVEAILNIESDVLHRLYTRIAGEVEARNVESRIKMTEEERRKTLASETEDVAREDQIFLRENVGKAEMGSRVNGHKDNTKSHFSEAKLNPSQQAVVDRSSNVIGGKRGSLRNKDKANMGKKK